MTFDWERFDMEFNLGQVHEAIAAAVPDRECVVYGDLRLSYAAVTERSRRLSAALRARGLGTVVPRERLNPWESGQDHVALILHNCNEYLETMLAAFKARVVPFNVNYRYEVEELRRLLIDAQARGVVFHSRYADTLSGALEGVEGVELLVQVRDASDRGLLDGAVWYDDLLSRSPPDPPNSDANGDDLFILYTGGTTGLPKGVLWRQADVFVAAMAGRHLGIGNEFSSLEEVATQARSGVERSLIIPPLMHGAALWLAFITFHLGGTVIIPDTEGSFDPAESLRLIEAERATRTMIVGDAFARSLLEELERGGLDLSSLTILVTGGAALSVENKRRLIEHLPQLTIIDAAGSSESGNQLNGFSSAAGSTARFRPSGSTSVISLDRTRVLDPDEAADGWLASRGRIPLGYLGDEAKTRETFPTIGGDRWTIPGDRVHQHEDGSVSLLGRGSGMINTGGEKVFAEEVEEVLKRHPSVVDALVVGRPSPQWGHEVVGLVQLRDAAAADGVREFCRGLLAGFKVPKDLVVVSEIRRTPAGKADYRWARSVVEVPSRQIETTVDADRVPSPCPDNER